MVSAGNIISSVFCQACLAIVIIILSSGVPAQAAELKNGPAHQVKIGYLVTDNKSTAAVNGAELAIRKANKAGNSCGFRFSLIVKSMEGPWGTGSKQAVRLIFDDKVWALSGSHDGRNAHIVEQAATKTQVVFISSWSADPTLSQAFVPWFFNSVPNDLQQAEALIQEICSTGNPGKIAIIYNEDYDSRLALSSLARQITARGLPDVMEFRYEDYNRNAGQLLDQLILNKPGCIILFCTPAVSHELFLKIKQSGMSQPLYGSVFILNEDLLTADQLRDFNHSLMIPSGSWSAAKSNSFINEYRQAFGKDPGMVAAYAYDGMNVLIEAIIKAGSSDREKIQKALEEIKHKGITGTFSFDEMGNREEKIAITRVRDGLPLPPTR